MDMFPTTQNDASDLEAFRNTLVNETKESAPVGNVDFLSFSGKGSKGEFIFGRAKEDILGASGIVVNSRSFCHGWMLWIGRKPVVKQSVSIAKPLPSEPDPQEETVGPNKGKMMQAQESREFQAQFLDAEPGSNPILFSTSSMGGRQAVSELITAVKAKAAQGSDYLFPIITLEEAPWANDNRRPVFRITGWMDQDGNEESGTQRVAGPIAEVEIALEQAAEVDVPVETETPTAPVVTKRRRRAAAPAA